MASRHRARVVALQSLFEWDLVGHDPEAALEQRVQEERLPAEVAEYARRLIRGVRQHRAEIDQIIREAAPTWPLNQLPVVDRNILRLAIFEILFDNTVPVKVAIDEAVELAKEFGGEASPKFINGVLGTVAARAAR
jgi:N utilization substance protein B